MTYSCLIGYLYGIQGCLVCWYDQSIIDNYIQWYSQIIFLMATRRGVDHDENEGKRKRNNKNCTLYDPRGMIKRDRLRAVRCRPLPLRIPILERRLSEQGKYEEGKEKKIVGKQSSIHLVRRLQLRQNFSAPLGGVTHHSICISGMIPPTYVGTYGMIISMGGYSFRAIDNLDLYSTFLFLALMLLF